MIPVYEIYVSPNGEGVTTGLMTLFVRVAGCNLAMSESPCSYCDTDYSWSSDSGEMMTVEQLRNKIEDMTVKIGVDKVCFTGGEPLIYAEELRWLIGRLFSYYHVTIETNGSLPIWIEEDWFDSVMWSMDIKCPSSGNDKNNDYSNISKLRNNDQLKLVIGNRADFDFARGLVLKSCPVCNLVFQPVHGMLSHEMLIDWVKASPTLVHQVRIGTQCHKIWYPDRKEGV